jgi:hypothetical protein
VFDAHCRGANTVTLKRQRSLWEGDQEVVKRSGRDEPMWVVIHLCMEPMLGISLYSYPYLKLAKTLCLIIAYVFSSIKLEKRAEQVLPGSKVGRREREGAGGQGEKWSKQCMYI